MNRLNGHANGHANGNGKPRVEDKQDVPPGGRQIHDELVMYTLPNGHFYLHLPTRTWLKGFTRIIGNLPPEEPLLKWIANQGSYEAYQEALQKAGRRGTAVHRGIEDLLKCQKLKANEFDREVWEHLQSFVNWFNDYQPETHAVEEPVWDIRRKIASKIDWRGMVSPPVQKNIKNVQERVAEKVHAIIDFKSASGIWESAWYQTSEYAWTYNDQKRFDELGPVKAFAVVRTGTSHRRGYDYQFVDAVADAEQHEYRHKVFNCLLWIEHSRDKDWTPKFPKPAPKELQLPTD